MRQSNALNEIKKKMKRSEIVRYWLEKAEESLASARRELEAGSFSFAMNRLYYGVFYGVRTDISCVSWLKK
jgi:hypothetical protein